MELNEAIERLVASLERDRVYAIEVYPARRREGSVRFEYLGGPADVEVVFEGGKPVKVVLELAWKVEIVARVEEGRVSRTAMLKIGELGGFRVALSQRTVNVLERYVRAATRLYTVANNLHI